MLLTLADLLDAQECDRAHYITAFFLIGFGKGVRWRKQLVEMGMGPSQAMIDTLRACIAHDNPFIAGFDLGVAFEGGKFD